MRSKANALDYRYFPEPDLPPLHLPAEWIAARRGELQELPVEKIKRYRDVYGFNKEYINVLIGDIQTNQRFEQFVKDGFEPALIAKWFAGPLAKYLNQHMKNISDLVCTYETMKGFFSAIQSGSLSDAHAKQVFEHLLAESGSVEDIVAHYGFTTMTDEELGRLAQEVFADNPQAVADLKA